MYLYVFSYEFLIFLNQEDEKKGDGGDKEREGEIKKRDVGSGRYLVRREIRRERDKQINRERDYYIDI